MSVKDDQVHVRFFGGKHTFADISAKKCYLFSDESPDFPKRTPIKNQRRNSIDKSVIYKSVPKAVLNVRIPHYLLKKKVIF